MQPKEERVEDLKCITLQLGRKPYQPFQVVKRCSEGFPEVILTAPRVEEDGLLKPFPTIFYLTCPLYVERVSFLESKGIIEVLQARVNQDQEFKEQLIRAHRDYIHCREKLIDTMQLTDDQRALLNKLKDRGIAGIKDFSGIKCLHAHLAHQLVRKVNPVGEYVYQRLQSSSQLLTEGSCSSKYRSLCDNRG